MTTLKSLVDVRMRYSRSVNLEMTNDSDSQVGDYVLTARSLEALDRIVSGFEVGGLPKSWTITGPYGTGKSAFARLLTSLLGRHSAARAAAIECLRYKDESLALRFLAVRELSGHEDKGLIVAVATANREPATRTIARALLAGIDDFRGGARGRPPRVRTEIRDLAQETSPDPRELIAAYDDLVSIAPVVLVVDEFGKNLEFAAENPSTGDLYVLQQLAERLTERAAHVGALITLQHMSFADYAFGLSSDRLREWNKVQGRFEDISFLEADDQTIQLVGASLIHDDKTASARSVWADQKIHVAGGLGVQMPSMVSTDLVADCYPLSPISVAALATLVSRYGQYERSLFSFLTSREPYSLSWFLESTFWRDPPPEYPFHNLYDYFIGGATELPGASAQVGRWLEIKATISEATGLPEAQRRLLKTIALLNLIGSAGGLSASFEVIEAAGGLVDRSDIDSLVDQGIVTYREFAKEYRVWEGTDYDLNASVASARDGIDASLVIEQIADVLALNPRVAPRHSLESTNLRYFEQQVLERAPSDPETTIEGADGLILYELAGYGGRTPAALTHTGERPVITVRTPDSSRIAEAARESAALISLLREDDTLKADRVAVREARSRAAIAQSILEQRLRAAFDPRRSDVEWWALGERQRVGGERDLAALLSDLFDRTFHSAPCIPNEMVNRNRLTSQGSRARRELMAAMVDNQGTARLGLTGNGPDVAVLNAILIQGSVLDESSRICMPPKGSTLAPAAKEIASLIRAEANADLDEVFHRLTLPPYGVKQGVIPILIAVVLLALDDEIAIFQDGSFEPRLTSEVLERLVKSPDRFSARYVGSDGRHHDVIKALRSTLSIRESSTSDTVRNATLLSILRPVLAGLKRLPEFSLRTRLVSPRAQRVRDALEHVREPDTLLFDALPEALGVSLAAEGAPEVFAEGLRDALMELRDAYQTYVRQWVASELVHALWPANLSRTFNPSSDLNSFRGEARSRGRLISEQVLDQRLRSFLLYLTNDQLPDDEWLDAIALSVSGRPALSWRDADRGVFTARLKELVGTFDRVNALYFDSRAAASVDGFTALRITLTTAEAQERDRVVWVDDTERRTLEEIAEVAMEAAAAVAGPDGPESLLVVLAESVLPMSMNSNQVHRDLSSVSEEESA